MSSSCWWRDTEARWHLDLVEAPDLDHDPLTLAIIRDDHLRVTNGTAEDDYLYRLRKVSYDRAERVTRRPLIPQRHALVIDCFVCSDIEIPMAQLLSVDEIEYVDEDGHSQVLSGGTSPADFEYTAPMGPKATRGSVRPRYGEVWPTTRYQRDAVRIKFTAGYPLLGTSPDVADIPEDITHGRLITIAELYKQRAESVHAANQSPALIRARDLWLDYRAY